MSKPAVKVGKDMDHPHLKGRFTLRIWIPAEQTGLVIGESVEMKRQTGVRSIDCPVRDEISPGGFVLSSSSLSSSSSPSLVVVVIIVIGWCCGCGSGGGGRGGGGCGHVVVVNGRCRWSSLFFLGGGAVVVGGGGSGEGTNCFSLSVGTFMFMRHLYNMFALLCFMDVFFFFSRLFWWGRARLFS